MKGLEKFIGHELPRIDMVAHTILGLIQVAMIRRVVDPNSELDVIFADLRRTIILIVSDRVNHPGVYTKTSSPKTNSAEAAPSATTEPSPVATEAPPPLSMSSNEPRAAISHEQQP